MPKLNVNLETKWPRVVAVTIAHALLYRDDIAVLVGGTENRGRGDAMDKVSEIVEECLRDALGGAWLSECKGYGEDRG